MRSDEWLDEFGPYLQAHDDETKSLILDGSIEICPGCNELSAYAYQDTTDDDDVGPKPGDVASIGAAGWSEWECGHCLTRWMEADSPLNHPAYTHNDEDDDDY